MPNPFNDRKKELEDEKLRLREAVAEEPASLLPDGTAQNGAIILTPSSMAAKNSFAKQSDSGLPKMGPLLLKWGIGLPAVCAICAVIINSGLFAVVKSHLDNPLEFLFRDWRFLLAFPLAILWLGQFNWLYIWSRLLFRIAIKTGLIEPNINSKRQLLSFCFQSALANMNVAGLLLALYALVLAPCYSYLSSPQGKWAYLPGLVIVTMGLCAAVFLGCFAPVFFNARMLVKIRSTLIDKNKELGARFPLWLAIMAPFPPGLGVWWLSWNTPNGMMLYLFLLAPLSYLLSMWALKHIRDLVDSESS